MTDTDKKLKPCPFCGGRPGFSDVEEMDDRRYVKMELECCGVMTAVIGYQRYSNMTDSAIHAELTDRLVEQWNAREDEQDCNFWKGCYESQAAYVDETIQRIKAEHKLQIDLLIGALEKVNLWNPCSTFSERKINRVVNDAIDSVKMKEGT